MIEEIPINSEEVPAEEVPAAEVATMIEERPAAAKPKPRGRPKGAVGVKKREKEIPPEPKEPEEPPIQKGKEKKK